MAQCDNILHFSSVYRLGKKEAFSGRLVDTEGCYLSMLVVLDIIITIFKVTRAASLSRAFEDEEKSIGSSKLIFLNLIEFQTQGKNSWLICCIIKIGKVHLLCFFYRHNNETVVYMFPSKFSISEILDFMFS